MKPATHRNITAARYALRRLGEAATHYPMLGDGERQAYIRELTRALDRLAESVRERPTIISQRVEIPDRIQRAIERALQEGKPHRPAFGEGWQ